VPKIKKLIPSFVSKKYHKRGKVHILFETILFKTMQTRRKTQLLQPKPSSPLVPSGGVVFQKCGGFLDSVVMPVACCLLPAGQTGRQLGPTCLPVPYFSRI
jgi:hypothetical protein